MSAEEEVDQSGYEDGTPGGPGAPTPVSALEGIAGLTKRDIQLLIDGNLHTVESIAYTPKKALEQIKGISEQKATKLLIEGQYTRAEAQCITELIDLQHPSSFLWDSPPLLRCTNGEAS